MDRTGVVAAAVLSALAGSAWLAPLGCSEPSRRGETQKETPTMDDLLRALDRHPDVTVVIRQGTEHFDDGLITLAIHGDGNATVEQRRSGREQQFTARLPAARIASLGGTLADHRFTAARTTKLPREPGDTPLLLRVDRGGAPAFQVEIWYADRYQDRDLDAIVRLADALIHEVTGGKLGQAPP